MFGTLPAFGFFVRHAQGISMRDIVLTTMTPDSRLPIVLQDVRDLTIANVTGAADRRPGG
jgi:hypothetical protein